MKFLNKMKDRLALMNIVAQSDQKNIDRLFARVFSTDDGQKILAYLHHITANRVMSAQATEEQLRHMEGQRALVQTIQKLSTRGRNE